jgi:hypothetical protein
MKGSLMYKFIGDSHDYRVHISRLGELDSGDLEVIAALLKEDIRLQKAIESGEITPTPLDPTGIGQLVRLGHARIARAIMFAQAGSTLYFVVNNYKIAGHTMFPIHFTSDAARPRTTVALER